MKVLVISILLFLTANAQNVWYVDRDSPTKGNALASNGRSWATAWARFDSTTWYGANDGINWSVISPGDTIYISGGTDSTCYTPESVYGTFMIAVNPSRSYTFASGNPVVLAPSYETGHNGNVYFTTSSDAQQRVLWVQGLSNLKFVNMTFKNRQLPPASGNGVVIGNPTVRSDSMITFENCHFTTHGTGGPIGISYSRATVKKCLIDIYQNNADNDQDVLDGTSTRGGMLIDSCLVIYRNTSTTTTAHRDVIQISSQGDPGGEYAINTIRNSIFINQLADGENWNGMGYFVNPINLTWRIYNNIFISEKNDNLAGMWFRWLEISNGGEGQEPIQNAEVFNNTFVFQGTTTYIQASIDTVWFYNNLCISYTNPAPFLNTATYTVFFSDYNFYASPTDPTLVTPYFATRGGGHTWSAWTGAGYDTASVTDLVANVSFVNVFDSNAVSYNTTSGRGQGVNLWDEYPFLRYDILGNPRPQTGNWDIGAIQYTGVQSNNVIVKSKVYLQGPFNSNSLSTALNQSGFLPNSQPYNSPPWNYNGNENLGSGPNSTMVDWVLVELRSASNPSQVVERRAALLKNNGLLLETNGIEGVNFPTAEPGTYYIAIYHRNHLAIMSSGPVQLSANSTTYDFTTGQNKAYGQNPMIELATGIYGMFASDGNGDGVIDLIDRDEVWLMENGNMGYLEGDFNMNSGVTVHDVNQFWNFNNGKITQVPQ